MCQVHSISAKPSWSFQLIKANLLVFQCDQCHGSNVSSDTCSTNKRNKWDFNTLTVCILENHACLAPWRHIGKKKSVADDAFQVPCFKCSLITAMVWRCSMTAQHMGILSEEAACAIGVQRKFIHEGAVHSWAAWADQKAECFLQLKAGSYSRMEALWISNSDEHRGRRRGAFGYKVKGLAGRHMHSHTYVSIKSC